MITLAVLAIFNLFIVLCLSQEVQMVCLGLTPTVPLSLGGETENGPKLPSEILPD